MAASERVCERSRYIQLPNGFPIPNQFGPNTFSTWEVIYSPQTDLLGLWKSLTYEGLPALLFSLQKMQSNLKNSGACPNNILSFTSHFIGLGIVLPGSFLMFPDFQDGILNSFAFQWKTTARIPNGCDLFAEQAKLNPGWGHGDTALPFWGQEPEIGPFCQLLSMVISLFSWSCFLCSCYFANWLWVSQRQEPCLIHLLAFLKVELFWKTPTTCLRVILHWSSCTPTIDLLGYEQVSMQFITKGQMEANSSTRELNQGSLSYQHHSLNDREDSHRQMNRPHLKTHNSRHLQYHYVS